MISVIIPAYNASRTITRCLQAIRQQSLDTDEVEIWVVDDGSTDDTARLAEECGARVIRQQRGWPAAARNAGIRAAAGSILCFTDADCVPAPDWLQQLTLPLADPRIAGVKGIYATHQKEWVARFVQLEYEDKYDRLRGQPSIDFVDTYSAAYRRNILLENSGFREDIRYVEDQELSFRLALRGHRLVFQPTALVYHLHSHTLPKYFRKKLMIGFWKAQVVRRFPSKALKDSHTPQVLKVQMALIALCLACAIAASLQAVGAIPLAAATCLFLITTLPFLRKAWAKDRGVAIASPFLLAVRALALTLGFAWGSIISIK